MISKRNQYMIRRGALITERMTWINQWRELSQYVQPRTGRFLVTDRNKGDKRYNSILDSTGTRSLRVLAAGLMAGMTSPARPWFRLSTTDISLMKYGPVKTWLSQVTDIMRTIFNRSNTYNSLHGLYEELGLYGTGVSFVMPDFQDVLRHYPSTCGEYMIATDSRNQVSTVYREYDMTVAAVVEAFGRENCSSSVQNMWDTGKNLDSWVTVLHVVEPRADRERDKSRLGQAYGRNLPFSSCYLEPNAAEMMNGGQEKFLRESGFKRLPGLAARWHATGGDVYGNSPGMESLGDIKQLQHGQLRKAQAIDYKVKPPLQIPTSLKNMPLATLPGGSAFVDQTNPNGGIRSMFNVELDINHQLEDIKDIRQRIKENFYVDLFLMIAQAVEGIQPMTAREVAERHEEKLLMLGPVLERLHNELLKPMIDLAFDRMIEVGIVPQPPQEMQGQDLNVEFVSMLAQAQRAIGVQGVDRLVQTVGNIAVLQRNAGQQPDALDKLDFDDIIDGYADMLGCDPEFVVANDKVALIRQMRAEQQAKEAQAAKIAAAADTAKTLSQAKTGPMEQNALTDVISQFSGYGGPGQAAAA